MAPGDGTDELERLVTKLARMLGEPSMRLDAQGLERLRGIGGIEAVGTLVDVCKARRDGRLTGAEAIACVGDIEAGGWAWVAERLGQPSSAST